VENVAQTNSWQESVASPSSTARTLVRRAPPSPSMSMRFWKLDWSAHLPWYFDDGRAEVIRPEDALPFIRTHYPSIFGKPDGEGQFLASPMTEAKRRFFDEMDFFMLRVDDRDAGIVMGHPTDWTSYYVRSAALLPEFRDRRMLTQFGERLFEPLRAAGAERVEAECSPANVPMARLLTGQGYIVTASTNSERWGVMLRYTKFLAPDAQAAFMRQYTSMPFAQRSRSKPNAQGGRHEEVRSHEHLSGLKPAV
jgi:hypothetical protein